MLAMAGCGEYADVETACGEIIRDKAEILPCFSKHERYNQKFLSFKEFYEKTKIKS